MFKSTIKCFIFIFLICSSVCASVVFAKGPAGEVEALEGRAWAQAVGKAQRELRKNGVYYSGEQIRTGSGSSIRLRFNDNTMFTLGSRSRMVVDDYTRTKDGEESFSARTLFLQR